MASPPPPHTLETFLAARRAAGRPPTHVRFGAATGSFVVPDDELDALLRLYAEAVERGSAPGLCEMPRADGMPLIADLDIAVPIAEDADPPDERLWNMEGALRFCDLLYEYYATRFDLGDAEVSFYISARAQGYEKDGKWKDGLHIQCPDLWLPASAHRTIRRLMLKDFAEQCSLSWVLQLDDAIETPDADIWDARLTSGSQPWFMLGSAKVETEPYDVVLTRRHVAGREPVDVRPGIISHAAMTRLLSLRLQHDEDDFAPTTAFQEEMLCDGLASTRIVDNEGGAAGGAAAHAPDPTQREKVEALLALLSDARAERMGLERGAEGCAEVIQCVCNVLGRDGRDLALAFARRSTRHWGSEAAAAAAKTWFASVFHPFKPDVRGVGALVKWARADSPEAYAAWQLTQPRSDFAAADVSRALSPERCAALLKEVTGLDVTGVELVPDKGGALPFRSRFIFGTGADAAAAGLNDLRVFQERGSTVVIRSHLGTGKTTLFRALAADATLRVLYISARRTFTRHMLSEFNEAGLGFRSYMGCEGACRGEHCEGPNHVPKFFSPDDPRCARFFCQAESLHKFYGEARFDLVVLDEIESILAALQPGATQRANLVENVARFEKLVGAAGVVIAGDAFVSDRTMAALKALRPARPPKLLLNEYNPYEGRVCERIKVMREDKKRGLVEDLGAGKAAFHARIVAELDARKRIVIVCASQQEGIDLEEGLLKPRAAANPEFRYRFYHGKEEDKDKRNADLENVHESWAALDVLLYTPTITVGINYDNKARPFDLLFLYGSRMGPTARDVFQGSLRCRSLRENKAVFFLSSRGCAAFPTGMAAIQTRLDEVTHGSTTLREGVMREAAEAAAAKLKKGGPAGGRLAEAAGEVAARPQLSPWFVELLVRNANEAAVNQTLPEEVYSHYLRECGYTVTLPPVEGDGLVLEKFDQIIAYRNLADLDAASEDFDRIAQALKADTGVLTQADRQAMVKFYFRKRCGLLREAPTYTASEAVEAAWAAVLEAERAESALRRAGATEEEVLLADEELRRLRLAFRRQRDAECAAMEEAAAAVPGPAWATPENLGLLWGDDTSSGFARGDAGKFWHAAIEKMPPAAGDTYASRIDATSGYAVIAALDKGLLTTRLRLVRSTLAVLGLEHSAAPKTWSNDEWVALISRFSEAVEWADLPAASNLKVSSLRERLRVAFNLRHRYAKDTNVSAAIHLRDDVNRVLSAWSGTQLVSSKAGAGAQVREGLEPGVVLKSEYAIWAESRRAELYADPTFSPTKLKPGVKVKSRQPAADWEEGASPTARKQAIDVALKDEWAEEKARRGVGEPKFQQPHEFRTKPYADGLLWTAVAAIELRDDAVDFRDT